MTIVRPRRLLVVFLVGAFVGCGGPAGPQPEAEEDAAEPTQAQIDEVQADVRKMQTALYSGDYKTVVAMTNRQVLSSYDTSPEEAAAEMEAAMSLMQDAGVELEVLTFPDAPTFFSSDEHDFVLVPMLSADKIGRQRVETRTFFLGIKPRGGGAWTYIAGEHFEGQNVVDLFPDYPLDQPFPDTSKRRL